MRRIAILAVLALAAVLAWQALLQPPPPPLGALPSGAASPTSPASATPSDDGAREVTAHPQSAEAGPAPLRSYPIERRRAVVRGQVRDEFEQPVAGARVVLQPTLGSAHALLWIADDRDAPAPTVADVLGRFTFADAADGPYRLVARAPDGRQADRQILVRDDDAPWILHVGASSDRLLVLVADGAGARIAGAEVAAHLVPRDRATVAADAPPAWTATTDAHGAALLSLPLDEALVVTARDAHGAIAVAPLGAMRLQGGREPVTLVLAPPGGLRVRLDGVAAADLAGAQVDVLGLSNAREVWYTGHGLSWTAAVRDGVVAVADLPAGDYALSLRSPRGQRFAMGTAANPFAPCTVAVASGVTTEATVAVEGGGTILGTVRTAEGAPVAAAEILATLVPATGDLQVRALRFGVPHWRLDVPTEQTQVHPATHARATTDAEGHYALRGLPDGPHRVEVFARGLAFDRRADVAVTAAAPVELEHVLVADGVVQGHVSYGSCFGIRRPGAATALMVAQVGDDGLFTFAGVPAGDFELGKADLQGRWLTLAPVHVVAGRTTWIDLDRHGPVRLAGVLRDGHGAPVDATVEFWHMRKRTAADGSFELRLSWPMRSSYGSQTLKVERGDLRWELPFPESADGATDWNGEFRLGSATLAVTVVDAAGNPVPARAAITGGHLSNAPIATGADGRTELSLLLDGEYQLQAIAPDLRFEARTATVPNDARIELRASPSSVLEVLALDAAGHPRPRATVQFARWNGEGPPSTNAADYHEWDSATTDLRGRARLVVAPGAHLVSTPVHRAPQDLAAYDWDGWDRARSAQQVVQTAAAVTAAVTLRLP